MNNFMIGCDPEIFVADAQGALRSIIGNLGGTKECPLPLPIGDGFAVQEDNVAMEFNIPASGSRDEFINNVVKAREFLNSMMQDMYEWQIVNMSAASFPEAELQHPAAHVFGCDPDFNAWTGKVNPRPRAADRNLRSCGGHVHIGTTFDTKEQAMEVIRGCDVLLGIPSVLMDNGDLRKQLYGKHGAFRYKPYGVEYRTLSNFWIFDEKYIGWVYDNVARVLDAVRAGASFVQLEEQVTQCIDNNDKDLARKLVQDFNLEVVYA